MANELSDFIDEELQARGYSIENQKLPIQNGQTSSSFQSLESEQNQLDNIRYSQRKLKKFVIVGLVFVVLVAIGIVTLTEITKNHEGGQKKEDQDQKSSQQALMMESNSKSSWVEKSKKDQKKEKL
eukprot:TRINITY_DN3611_c0_g1_i12.p1 TRINITY_DN3611_c0_g1~~TRINITY_DN3611_c0_g1_i12.p1  ORF type:complete len:147 (-),score=20.36 TRINITY_DN3611_c0_g1_i12:41-418(-)